MEYCTCYKILLSLFQRCQKAILRDKGLNLLLPQGTWSKNCKKVKTPLRLLLSRGHVIWYLFFFATKLSLNMEALEKPSLFNIFIFFINIFDPKPVATNTCLCGERVNCCRIMTTFQLDITMIAIDISFGRL